MTQVSPIVAILSHQPDFPSFLSARCTGGGGFSNGFAWQKNRPEIGGFNCGDFNAFIFIVNASLLSDLVSLASIGLSIKLNIIFTSKASQRAL